MRMSFEWFQSLLLAIEEQDIDQFIEIHTYLTARLRHSDIGNILVNDDGNIKDTITGLRAPTHYGRPNWDRIFSNMREQHPSTDVGVFFCGPKPLGKLLNNKCNLWSQGSEEGTNFVYGKGKNTFCLFLQAYGNAFAVILNPSFEVLMFLDKSSKDTINSKKSTIIPITNITIPDQSSYTYARQFISITNIFDDLTDVTKLAQQLLCHALDMKKNDWSKIRMFEFRLNLDEKAQLMNKIDSFQCIKCPELNEHYGLIHEIMSLGKKLDELLHTITGENLELMPEYEQRIEVLKSLKYIDEKTSVVQLRGQIACKIVKKADNESEYDPAEIVALLSSRKNASELTLTPNLEKLRSMLERFKEKKNVDIQVDDYVETIKFGLVQVVYELARGMYGLIHEIMSLGKKLDELLHTITGENLELMPEYEQRIEVLKSLKYIDEKTSVVQLRGQIACKIVKKADNESEYDPAEIVALLSSRKNASELTLTPNLEKLRSMLERFKEKKNVDIQVDDYVETIKFGLVQVVYELARGMNYVLKWIKLEV
ncbi:15002_t:CDS:10 [Entrophospora sp. SA101]|nr:15002_t:CDS:10 [Entrophospora sp. SA101]